MRLLANAAPGNVSARAATAALCGALAVCAAAAGCTATHGPQPDPVTPTQAPLPAGYTPAEIIAGQTGGENRSLPINPLGPPAATQRPRYLAWVLASTPPASARAVQIFFGDATTAACGTANGLTVNETERYVTIGITTHPAVTSTVDCDGGAVRATARVNLTSPLGTRQLLEPTDAQ